MLGSMRDVKTVKKGLLFRKNRRGSKKMKKYEPGRTKGARTIFVIMNRALAIHNPARVERKNKSSSPRSQTGENKNHGNVYKPKVMVGAAERARRWREGESSISLQIRRVIEGG